MKQSAQRTAMSCVVLITFGATRVLLTGDVTLTRRVGFAGTHACGACRIGWRYRTMAAAAHPAHCCSTRWARHRRWRKPVIGTASGIPTPKSSRATTQGRFSFFAPTMRARCSGASQAKGQARCTSTRETEARYWHNRPGAAAARCDGSPITRRGRRRRHGRRNSGTARALRGPLNCPVR